MKKIDSNPARVSLRLWLLLHRTHDLLKRREDSIFGECNLTTEQFTVLVTMRYLDDSIRPTDLARWLERSPNSVSMIIDRMVKAGLLKRVRDKSDRRVVHVVMTEKAENALKPATLAGLDFIQEILTPLAYEDRHTLVSLLEMIKYNALKRLSPGVSIEEMRKSDITNRPDLMKRLTQYISTSTPEAKCQRGEKGKTV